MLETLALWIIALVERLQALDMAAFHLINHDWIHPALDPVMVFLTQLGLGHAQLTLLIPLYVWGGPAGRRTAILCAIAFLVSGLGAQILKNGIPRLRPFLVVDDCRFLTGVLRFRSFPSGHTATSFAIAWVAGARHPRWRAPLLLLAALIGYSRAYVGVHFPGDALAAAVIGIATGVASLEEGRRLDRRRAAGLPAVPPEKREEAGVR
ncbi:MAG: phosphatase PAP2 family protein [Armatimonadetes bacterium]|nr:phosphatase PAP2 family protein [Armatimonadota bacterium]